MGGFWDPIGFCKGKDEETFLNYRGIELKHGRVAMLACAGFLFQPLFKVPGVTLPDGVSTMLSTQDQSYLYGVVFLIVGFFELKICADLESAPGNYGNPFKWQAESSIVEMDEDTLKNMELNNGRLAMFGAIGAITANLYTGLDTYQQWSQAGQVS